VGLLRPIISYTASRLRLRFRVLTAAKISFVVFWISDAVKFRRPRHVCLLIPELPVFFHMIDLFLLVAIHVFRVISEIHLKWLRFMLPRLHQSQLISETSFLFSVLDFIFLLCTKLTSGNCSIGFVLLHLALPFND
jgi:hypothetical protein